MNRLPQLLILLVAASFLQVAHAHESRPAYLEINETIPGRYDVLWRTPLNAGMPLPIVLKFPDGVDNVREPATRELPDSLVERRIIKVTDSLAGKRINFVGLQATITDVLVRVKTVDGQESTTLVHPSQPWFELSTAPSKIHVAGAYLRLGIEHIWSGIDHLLFILAINDSRERHAPSRGHSDCVYCRTQHHARGRDAWVRACATEACRSLYRFEHRVCCLRDCCMRARAGRVGQSAWPWIVAFTFGLLHGFGFAGALECGRPASNAIPVALLFFNVGVEIGQLLFIAAILSIMALGRWLIRRTAIPKPAWAWRVAPYSIGGVAAFWMIQRIAAF